MLFDITHQTEYSYSQPVFLEPHVIRLHPRGDGSQWLESYEISVDPEPVGLTHSLDAEGNTIASAWFSGVHDKLSISIRSRVKTLRENPFDFLLQSPLPIVPQTYPESLKWLLASACNRKIHRFDADPVHDFAVTLKRRSNDALAFLSSLNRTLFEEMEIVHRELGPPHSPVETLQSRRGACRDLAVLFIDACRAMGLAARFVSGYQEGDRNRKHRDLHAWAEVYLPGAGWRGYDPTHGLAVSNRHVVVAAASDPRNAAPVSGSFRGDGATATMNALVQIRVNDSPSISLQDQRQHQHTA